MKPDEASQSLWTIEYISRVNHLYYDRLSARWNNVDLAAKASGALATIGGLIIGNLAAPAFMFSVLGFAGLVFLLLFPSGSFHRKNLDLRQRWIVLVGACQELYIRIQRVNSNHKIGDDLADELVRLNREKSKIEQDEHQTDRKLLEWCQEQVNRQLYAVSDGSYEEVMKSLFNPAETAPKSSNLPAD